MIERMTRTVDWSIVPVQFLIWAVVCCGSAAPSFFWGANLHPDPMQLAALVAGIMMFVIAYTLVGSAYVVKRWRAHNKALRRTLQIGYGTRLLLSAIFPVSIIVDAWIGLASISIVQVFSLGGVRSVKEYIDSTQGAGFGKVLVTTLVQGVLLNIVLGIYMLIVYAVARMVWKRKADLRLCNGCGYDLRASTGAQCPECGSLIARL